MRLKRNRRGKIHVRPGLIQRERDLAGQRGWNAEGEPVPFGHVTGNLDQQFDLQRHGAATVELRRHAIAIPDEFGAAAFDRKLLHRHVVAEERNGPARGGRRELQRGIQQRHAVVHRPGVTGGNDGTEFGVRSSEFGIGSRRAVQTKREQQDDAAITGGRLEAGAGGAAGGGSERF